MARYTDSKPSVVLDITGVSREPLLTGVQRISRGLAEGAGSHISFVQFSERTGRFHLVSGLPRLTQRADNWFSKRARKWLQNLVEQSTNAVRRHTSLARFIPPFFHEWVWNLYVRELGDWTTEDPEVEVMAQPWSATPGITFVTAEIPRSLTHLAALKEIRQSAEKTMVYLHDLIPVTSPELLPSIGRAGVRGLFLEYLDFVLSSDDVVCNSEETKRAYRKYSELVPPHRFQKMRVVYPPLNTKLSSIQGLGPEVPLVGRDFIPTDTNRTGTHVLFIGNLGSRKNLETLLRAVFNAIARRREVYLHIVTGKGRDVAPEVAELLRSASPNQSKAIFLYHEVSDDGLWTLYETCDVLAIPSRNEGLGLPLLEALSQNMPVVASRTPVFLELSSYFDFTLLEADDVLGWETALLESRTPHPRAEGKRPLEFPADWNGFAQRLLDSSNVLNVDSQESSGRRPSRSAMN